METRGLGHDFVICLGLTVKNDHRGAQLGGPTGQRQGTCPQRRFSDGHGTHNVSGLFAWPVKLGLESASVLGGIGRDEEDPIALLCPITPVLGQHGGDRVDDVKAKGGAEDDESREQCVSGQELQKRDRQGSAAGCER